MFSFLLFFRCTARHSINLYAACKRSMFSAYYLSILHCCCCFLYAWVCWFAVCVRLRSRRSVGVDNAQKRDKPFSFYQSHPTTRLFSACGIENTIGNAFELPHRSKSCCMQSMLIVSLVGFFSHNENQKKKFANLMRFIFINKLKLKYWISVFCERQRCIRKIQFFVSEFCYLEALLL